RALLEHDGGLHGTLVDLPPVVAEADPGLRANGAFADRCELVGCDVTEELPVQADLYLIKHVVHMWDDDTALRALRTVARRARPGSRVVLAEQLLDAGPSPEVTTTMGLLMLVSQGGRERTG
ncbi:methyltransferase, partial [Streptomyces sp. SID11233]|nr:methyltransferase [Streptomyces sp. SID11233]